MGWETWSDGRARYWRYQFKYGPFLRVEGHARVHHARRHDLASSITKLIFSSVFLRRRHSNNRVLQCSRTPIRIKSKSQSNKSKHTYWRGRQEFWLIVCGVWNWLKSKQFQDAGREWAETTLRYRSCFTQIWLTWLACWTKKVRAQTCTWNCG